MSSRHDNRPIPNLDDLKFFINGNEVDENDFIEDEIKKNKLTDDKDYFNKRHHLTNITIRCSCGSVIKKKSSRNHLKTKIHLEGIKLIEKEKKEKEKEKEERCMRGCGNSVIKNSANKDGVGYTCNDCLKEEEEYLEEEKEERCNGCGRRDGACRCGDFMNFGEN